MSKPQDKDNTKTRAVPTVEPLRLGQTPSQTVGPFFHPVLVPEAFGYPFQGIVGNRIEACEQNTQAIVIEGQVCDGAGRPIEDALIEFWQADSQGRYGHPADGRGGNTSFRGFARAATGPAPHHRYRLESIKPGAVDNAQAPHINVVLFMRGLLRHLYTRIYFSDEAAANARDPVLALIPEARRATLIAALQETQGDDKTASYRFDIHMQGEKETVFFDF